MPRCRQCHSHRTRLGGQFCPKDAGSLSLGLLMYALHCQSIFGGPLLSFSPNVMLPCQSKWCCSRPGGGCSLLLDVPAAACMPVCVACGPQHDHTCSSLAGMHAAVCEEASGSQHAPAGLKQVESGPGDHLCKQDAAEHRPHRAAASAGHAPAGSALPHAGGVSTRGGLAIWPLLPAPDVSGTPC